MRKAKRIHLFQLVVIFLTFIFLATGCGNGDKDTTPPDTTPPDTSITSGPSDPTNQASATFEFTSTEADSTFECQMDGGGYSSCTSPRTYDGISDGSHTFEVRATDGADNTDQTPAYYTWTIDTTPPDGLVADPAGGSYCATPVTVYLSASDGTIYYTLDGSEPTTGSPVYVEPIDIGVETLKFMAVDVCGNQAATVTEVYDIDTEAVVTITSPVDGVTVIAGDVMISGTADNDITTAIVTSDQGHSELSGVDAGGNWSVVLAGVTESSMTIIATGTDNCGNVGSDSLTVPVYMPYVRFVDTDATTGNNDGTSWADAFTTVQAAADAALNGDWIWVAEGTYTNSPTTTVPVLTMKAGIEIYGGFTATETFLSDRGDPADNPTTIDGEDTSYHVIVGASNARLDGFIITGGHAFGFMPDNEQLGGGMYNGNVTDLLVANCTFSGNQAGWGGGGIGNYNSSPTITNCTFNGNLADWNGYGGGIYNESMSSPFEERGSHLNY